MAGSIGPVQASDPGELMRTCAICGSAMEDGKCKLIRTRGGYILSCSDYYYPDGSRYAWAETVQGKSPRS